MIVPSDGVDRDSGGDSGHGARARRDTATKCLSRLEPGLLSSDPPRLTVGIYYYDYSLYSLEFCEN